MITKKCKCGKSEKNFQFDIGEFFMGECCEELENQKPIEEVPPTPPAKKSFFKKNKS